MILGNFGIPQSDRLPFSRPPGAGFYTPRLPQTGFLSHINPFMNVMMPLTALAPRLPRTPARMEPTGIGPGAQPPIVMQSPTPPPAAMGPMAGFGASFSGRGRGLDPYAVIRSGMIPGVFSTSGRNAMRPVQVAAGEIQQLIPYPKPRY
jgi:hypothetical protein